MAHLVQMYNFADDSNSKKNCFIELQLKLKF